MKIVGATDGSNGEGTAASYDDNEVTDWKSDGSTGTAWIEYELECTATISEIVLKLGG